MKKIIILIAILITASFVFSKVDAYRLKNGNSPIFSIRLGFYKDGGTGTYFGLGYQIIQWHMLSTHNEKHGYLVGTELCYFPFFKDWVIFRTNFIPGVKLRFLEVQ